MKLGEQWLGKKHKAESNLKRSETMKRLYAEGKAMGFRSDTGKIAAKLPGEGVWKGKKLPYEVWNKGKKGVQESWCKGMKMPERQGRNSGMWQGGITPLRVQIQNTENWKNWIKTIMERDNYSCVKCGVKNNRLHVHHKKSDSQIRKEYDIKTVEEAINCEALWEIDNGEVLCKDCHKKTDTYLRKLKKEI